MLVARMIAAMCAVALIGAHARAAEPLPPTTPAAAGFSPERLERIDEFFAREIAAKRVPGAVVGIARDGKLLYLKAFGVRDPATGAPMQLDSVFGLASMTKPIVPQSRRRWRSNVAAAAPLARFRITSASVRCCSMAAYWTGSVS